MSNVYHSHRALESMALASTPVRSIWTKLMILNLVGKRDTTLEMPRSMRFRGHRAQGVIQRSDMKGPVGHSGQYLDGMTRQISKSKSYTS